LHPCRTHAEHRARRTVGKARNLLFPLRLERGGADHQDAGDALVARQQIAGRDGLYGLAEAHLVGEERALSERKMQHAFALIRQQFMAQHVERLPPGFNLGEEVFPIFDARRPHSLRW
jgi:hypothetical protein